MAILWTITDENSLPVISDFVFLSADIKADAKVSSYPIESGSFAMYNKTTSPCTIRVSLAQQGNDITLQDTISVIDTMKNTTQLVNIITPVTEYNKYNLQSYNYSFNNDDGIGLLVFDLTFIEVREVSQAYTNAITYPADPSATSTSDTGTKQTSSIASDIQAKVTAALGG